MKHATVNVGGLTIPLIGISKDETEDKCDVCGKRFHIQDLAWTMNRGRTRLLCDHCKPKHHEQHHNITGRHQGPGLPA